MGRLLSISLNMTRFIVKSALVCLGITNIKAKISRMLVDYPPSFKPDLSRPAFCDELFDSQTIHPSAVGKTDTADFVFIDETSDPILFSRECSHKHRNETCDVATIINEFNREMPGMMEWASGEGRWTRRQNRIWTKVFHFVIYKTNYRIQTTTPGNFEPLTTENYKQQGESRLADMIMCLLSEYQHGNIKMWIEHDYANFGWDNCETNEVQLGQTMKWMQDNLNWAFER